MVKINQLVVSYNQLVAASNQLVVGYNDVTTLDHKPLLGILGNKNQKELHLL